MQRLGSDGVVCYYFNRKEQKANGSTVLDEAVLLIRNGSVSFKRAIGGAMMGIATGEDVYCNETSPSLVMW